VGQADASAARFLLDVDHLVEVPLGLANDPPKVVATILQLDVLSMQRAPLLQVLDVRPWPRRGAVSEWFE
jgi:hypothetical protein